MTVTGGVEQVTTTLPMNFVKNMKYIFMRFLEKVVMFHTIWIQGLRTGQNWKRSAG